MSTPVFAFKTLPSGLAPQAGGKGKILARLARRGYPIPDGCLLLPAAFDGDDLTPAAWEQVQSELARLHKAGAAAFAVRSSALSEDSAAASFAGEFESVLDVRTLQDIRQAILTVRQSRHSQRVQAYSQAQASLNNAQALPAAENAQGHEMAVIIQRLVPADLAGVLFTVDPLTGSLSHMTGNFVHGLGEQLVSGQVNAQTFTFQRPKGQYTGPADLKPIARQLYRYARRLEQELGAPQDIEWAVAGGKLFILQARPITTLRAYNPVTAEWNDSLKGHFLWSATNLTEACPEVMTPFTASLRPYLEQRGGPSLTVKGYPLNGTIGGRFYANLSVQVSAFSLFFRGDTRRTYQEMAGWWGDIPDGLEIPILPLTTAEWLTQVLPELNKSIRTFGRYRKQIPEFLANNPQRCAHIRQRIQQAQTGSELAALWNDEIFPTFRDSLFFVVSASVDNQIRLERELRRLVGPEDANALLSNLGGASLKSLGPVLGLEKIQRGELTREAYLEAYGHRGENEGECAWPRPSEDPTWLDRQLAEFAAAPVSVETLLEKQRQGYEAAWQRLLAQHPKQASRIGKRIQEAAAAAQRREAVRSESSRGGAVLRHFALRCGELTSLDQDIFFLTIDEVLAWLEGDDSARVHLPCRKQTFHEYQALPPYPLFILGRFDPKQWAQQPDRRIDFYSAQAPSPVILNGDGQHPERRERSFPVVEGSPQPQEPDQAQDKTIIRGFAGALGVVEGTVRRLDRLEDSPLLQPGEILVTSLTNIGWTPVFPRAAAIITDLGAPLSHAAIVARELGIPAVVGCGDATRRLKTGDRVRVNGGLGKVEILPEKILPEKILPEKILPEEIRPEG